MTSRLLTLVLSACISVLGTAQEVVAQATRDLSPHRVGAVHRDGARSHFLEADAPALGKYTISTLVGDLHALLDSLRIDRVALVGHSSVRSFSRCAPTSRTR